MASCTELTEYFRLEKRKAEVRAENSVEKENTFESC